MVKIISRKSLGTQSVYDIGVEREHNFLLSNGLVASNCFNKSHSTAYAYVTYQTAYLKANYPVEYMAALLTASSNNPDKVKNYIDTCKKMGIRVEPPDINRSQIDFTPIGEEILFGLSAVRNLGQGAIEVILTAREEAGGTFESLADLCTRVDLQIVKRSPLETLIKCGGFDCLNPNRHQLLDDLDLIMTWARNRAKERESGQINLFDMFGNNDKQNDKNKNGFDAVPSAPPVEDFSLQEKLKQEKELLGFFVSEHPLDSLKQVRNILSPINLSDLAGQPKRNLVSAIAILAEVKPITTKKGDRMAFVQLEDATGQVEGVIFPATYERIQDELQQDARLIVWGKADTRDDKLQMILEDVEPVETAKIVTVELTPQQVQTDSENLKGILRGQAGGKKGVKIPVLAIVNDGQQRQCIRLGADFWVTDRQVAIAALQNARFKAREELVIPKGSA